ncbi:unnamed protein product [Ectocarpus sp. 4 AP-2014]
MGRRKKSTKKIVVKKNTTLDKVFKCPFCNHDKVVECTMNKKEKTARLLCRMCDVNYEMTINYLTEPIDVYTDWIDECEAVNAVDAAAEETKDDEQFIDDQEIAEG